MINTDTYETVRTIPPVNLPSLCLIRVGRVLPSTAGSNVTILNSPPILTFMFSHSHLLLQILVLFAAFGVTAAQELRSPDIIPQQTVFSIDLRKIQQDQLTVTAVSPIITGDTLVYVMPAIAPGTYSQYDFGRFVTDFHATATDGSELPVVRRSVNEFAIAIRPKTLKQVVYRLNDSFDDTGKPTIFQPCGTNIQQDTNVLMNFPGICGYFEGLKQSHITLEVTKPAYLYAATSLPSISRTPERDVFHADTYDDLVDNPVMYSRADTTTYHEGKTKITIAVFSMNGKVHSADVAEFLRPLTGAVHRFLGKMPVENYTFIMYFADTRRSDVVKNVIGTGALEHSYSSVYFLTEPENPTDLRSMIQHVGAHEFLHILVPLHLHSREIDDFDFLNPKMSQHLWLYEGVTEYFAHLAMLKGGLITQDEFITRIRQKLLTASMMSPRPFSLTEFSRNVLTDANQKLYPIIYEKGATAAFLLDILLNESTKGKMSLLGLVQKLSEEYGPHKSFNDDDLIGIIGKISPPAEQYLRQYIEGDTPLPFHEVLLKLGWEYTESQTLTTYSFGTLRFKTAQDSTALSVAFSFSDNGLHLMDNDVITSVNGTAITAVTAAAVEATLTHPPTSDEITVTVRRNGETLTLAGHPAPKEQKRYHVLTQQQGLSSEQTALQQWVLGEAGK